MSLEARLALSLALLLALSTVAYLVFDARLSTWEDGSGRLTWCAPWEICAGR